ncbi:MAG: hypothetical protein QOE86_4545, partial [Solirubrobacteraceae bacterium]|nr:hypothetical protein [Solirubrobacteraceae bacterium]
MLSADRVETVDGRWLRASADGGAAAEARLGDIAAAGGWSPDVLVDPGVKLPGPLVVAAGRTLVRLRTHRDGDGRLTVGAEPLGPHAEVTRVDVVGAELVLSTSDPGPLRARRREDGNERSGAPGRLDLSALG